MTDLIDDLVPAAALLRNERPEAKVAAQASLDALLTPPDPGGLTLAERAGAALRTARLHGADELAAYFQSALDGAALDAAGGGAAAPGRAHAIAAHVERLSLDPASARKPDIAALTQAGLSAKDIVSLSQLIALVSFQARLVYGLRLMGAGQ